MLYLYKTNFNTKTLIDIVDVLSVNSMKSLVKDLGKLEIVEDEQCDKENVYIFTDGGAKNNGKMNSRAGYGVFISDNHKYNGVWKVEGKGTNQIAELMGIREGLKLSREYFSDKKVILCTDSMYVIKCVTEWSKKWLENDWKTAKNEEVKNSKLIKEILEIYNKDKVEFKHVMSHMKEPEEKGSLQHKLWYGNKKVDEMINEILN